MFVRGLMDVFKNELLSASSKGEEDRVQNLLQNKLIDINVTDEEGATPLYIASRNGHANVVQVLLEANADINVIAKDGYTALNIACNIGHVDVVKCFLKAKANVNAVNEKGVTALSIASYYGHVEIVKILLKFGANINPATISGVTPLNYASQKGHVQVVEYLLNNHADANISDEKKGTPLTIASQKNDLQIVKLLLVNNANVNYAGDNGDNALHIASFYGHETIVNKLLEYNACANDINDDQISPLYFASQNGHCNVVRILIEHGANINGASKDGATPLYIASQNGHGDVVDSLLKHKADVNIANKHGETPLHIACSNGDVVVVHKLGRIARLDIKDSYGDTPIIIASKKGHREILEILQGNRKLAENEINTKERNLTNIVLSWPDIQEMIEEYKIEKRSKGQNKEIQERLEKLIEENKALKVENQHLTSQLQRYTKESFQHPLPTGQCNIHSDAHGQSQYLREEMRGITETTQLERISSTFSEQLQKSTHSLTEDIAELKQQNDQLHNQLVRYAKKIAHGMIMSHEVISKTIMLDAGNAEKLNLQYHLRNSFLRQHETLIVSHLLPDDDLLTRMKYSILTSSEKLAIENDTSNVGKIKRILLIVDQCLNLGPNSEILIRFINVLRDCKDDSGNYHLGKFLYKSLKKFQNMNVLCQT